MLESAGRGPAAPAGRGRRGNGAASGAASGAPGALSAQRPRPPERRMAGRARREDHPHGRSTDRYTEKY